MNQSTEAMVARLHAVELFAAVGQPVADDYSLVRSWPEAVRHSASDRWESIEQEEDNRLSQAVFNVSRELFQRWNDVVRELKQHIIPFVSDAVAKLGIEADIARQVVDSANWDLLGLLLESEYSTIVEPGFFSRIGHWYLLGHFPCGWDGDYPTGRLVLY